MPEWVDIDWKNLSNLEIAEETGLTSHYVAKLRKLLGYESSFLEQRKARYKILVKYLSERKIITHKQYQKLVGDTKYAALSDLNWFVSEGTLQATKSGALYYYYLP